MSKASVSATNKQLRIGLREYFNKKSLTLAGTTWTEASIVAALDKEDALVASTAKTRAAWTADVAALRAQTAANEQLRNALHAAVLVSFGKDPNVLGAFGYTPKVRKPTVETRGIAVQKVKATRAARNTMGKKQRASIHGVIATPTPAPAATDTSSSTAAATAIAPTSSPLK